MDHASWKKRWPVGDRTIAGAELVSDGPLATRSSPRLTTNATAVARFAVAIRVIHCGGGFATLESGLVFFKKKSIGL
jgi:hypothetical protein